MKPTSLSEPTSSNTIQERDRIIRTTCKKSPSRKSSNTSTCYGQGKITNHNEIFTKYRTKGEIPTLSTTRSCNTRTSETYSGMHITLYKLKFNIIFDVN